MDTRTLAALTLEPQERELVWGGTALAQRYGKRAAPGATIGESWECFDANRIVTGTLAGRTLAQARTTLGARLMGAADAGAAFPLLTKFIDARQALSVQVHPDDAYARRVEHQPNGKTESWYVLEAEADASIVLGWNRDTSRGEYLERVRDGSLGELLRRVAVRPGDAFFLPAGTMHAIGAGIVLFEVQQTSDLTYRIFDYDRPGPDGKPRELHVDKAADVLDYRRCRSGALQTLAYELDGMRRTALVAAPTFVLERLDPASERHGVDLEGMPLAVTALYGAVEIESRGEAVRLAAYQTAVIPAEADVAMVRALDPGAALLAAAPRGDREALARRFSRAAVPFARSTAFFAQF